MQDFTDRVQAFDERAAALAGNKWDSIAKPLKSLGYLEDAVCRIAGIQGTAEIDISKKAVIVCCADNGVVQEGVTQCGPEITALAAEKIASGRSSVSAMANVAHADVICVDMGMLSRVPGTVDMHIADGTGNIAMGPAMTREQAERAVHNGIELVQGLRDKGYSIIAMGEMGIGNTTTSAAMLSVLLGLEPEEVTGRGAGLSREKLEKKINVVRRAVQVNAPYEDALDVISKLGGFDIAGLAGVFIGGAICRVPVVIDGIISSAAALSAYGMCLKCKDFMLASHVSAEPVAGQVLERLGLKPLIAANMRLGEGTGAVCAFPLLDMAAAVYGGADFKEYGMDAYEHQE